MTNIAKPVTEEELQARAKAPRITPQMIEDLVVSENYFTAYEGVMGERFNHEKGEKDADEGTIPKTLGLTMFCILTLRNGWNAIGISNSASFENYDPQIGKRLARADAINTMWPILGYNLRTQMDNLKRDQALSDEPSLSVAEQLSASEAELNADESNSTAAE